MDTDYTSYVVVYSCGDYLTAGITYSTYSWVLVRDKIEDGSADFTAMMSKVDAIYEEKIPEYEHETRMTTT